MSEEKTDLPIEYSPGKFSYRGWKILPLSAGNYEAVRIRPTRFFRADTVKNAIGKIDRMENPFNIMKEENDETQET